ncbi:small integral membrane protein 1 [Eucyclogobius newberryi]|uniref:small integral membrane protein 1 n=1 Tax=Eucyclogobius newberryi TaxID=166745 RepID=UPI003B5AD1C7
MESNTGARVQYDRWNEDNINVDVEAGQTTMSRMYSRVCVGTAGITVKAAGALAALISLYILGYVTGFYVHKCGV